jgi:hypothetical protein
LRLRLIGALQTNKARDAVRIADAIESLDRPRLAAALADAMRKEGRRPELLVQVNTGDEAQKAGVPRAEADAFLRRCRDEHGLEVAGLMCIPPRTRTRARTSASWPGWRRGAACRPQHGHERRLRGGHRLRRHARAPRHGGLRRAASAAAAAAERLPRTGQRRPARGVGPRHG